MKDKIKRLLTNLKNTSQKIYGNFLSLIRGKNDHSFSYSLRKGKKKKYNINIKRMTVVLAAVAVLVVLAVIIFTPPKTKGPDASPSAVVAGTMQSADSVLQTETALAHDAKVADAANSNAEQTVSSDEQPEEGKTEETKKTEKKKEALAPNKHSKEVIELQERLMDLDYMDYDEPTDFYGPQTQYSLQLFQRKHNLQVDGVAGEDTLKLLYSKEAKKYTVFLGERGTDVEELQSRLIELGYLKGSPTGYFGTDTEAAVKTFQKQNDLSVDGNVGSDTREAIYSEDAQESDKPKKTTPKDNTPKKSEKSTTKVPNDKSVKSLIAFAKQQLGEPYVRGGKGPNKFDCSGFVYYCLKNIGVRLKYMTSGGWAKSSWPKVTKMKSLLAGDIICFRGHVGIYLGGGRMIDASSGQGKIRITDNIFKSSYWTRYFICGRRVCT